MKSSALRLLALAVAAVVVALLFLLDGAERNATSPQRPDPVSERNSPPARAPGSAAADPAELARTAARVGPDRAVTPSWLPADASSATPSASVIHLRGRVVDGLGIGIGACSIGLERRAGTPALGTATRDAGDRTTRTGIDGRFEFTSVPAGRFTLTIQHPQFPAWLASLHLPRGSGPELDLGDLALRSESGLRLKVVGADRGIPVADARITLEPALLDPFLATFGRRALVRTATTDQSGHAAIYGVPDGEYRLRVEANGRETKETRLVRDAVADPADRVERVELSSGELLRGRVVDAEGRPVAGVLVLGVPTSEPAIEWTERTASDGSFRLLGLPRGTFTLRAWTFDDDRRLASAPRTVEVPRDTPVELRLPRGVSLRGVVRDALDGTPIRDATVTAIPLEGTPVRAGEFAPLRTRTDPDGRFAIDGLSPGRTRLQVSSERYATALTAPQEPTEAPGPILEVALEPGVRVHGRVRDAAGSAMTHAVLQTVPESFDGSALATLVVGLSRSGQPRDPAARWSTRVTADGSFDAVLPLGAGTPFRLRVLAEDCAPWISPVLRAPDRATARTIGLDLGTVVVARAGSIQGTFRDEAGRPVVGAVVVAEPSSPADGRASEDAGPRPQPREGARTRTDANGRFDLPGLAPGRYDLWAASTGSSIEPRALRPRSSTPGTPANSEYRLDEPAVGPRRSVHFQGVEVQSQRVTPRDLDFRGTAPVESSEPSPDGSTSRGGAPR